MITLHEINLIVDWVEKHPVIGGALFASVAYTVKGIIQTIYKWFTTSSDYSKPTFWTLGKKFRITAVHQYLPSDDASGYTQIQNSRPDQWGKLITIKSTCFNLRHRIVPNEASSILAVIISRDGVEREKVISFNR